MTLRFNGIIAASTRHSHELSALSQQSEVDATSLSRVLGEAQQICQTVETECLRAQSSPAHLDVRSKEAYAWFVLLSEESHLRLHLQALRDARQVVEEWPSKTHRMADVQLLPLRSLWRATPRRGVIEHRFSELFAIADRQFWQSFFQAFARQQTTVSRRLLREFANTDDALEWMAAIEECIPADEEAAAGRVRDLDAIFNRVNERYFGGAMERPQIAWSRRPTRRVFGHYQFARDRLTVSRTLDADAVPEYVVEFIMFHELLHKKHGLTKASNRLYAHTAAFRTEERSFPLFKEVQQELSKLARQRRR